MTQELPGWFNEYTTWAKPERDNAETSTAQSNGDTDARVLTDPVAYGRAALTSAADAVRYAVEGSRNQTLNDRTLGLGHLVAAKLLDEPTVVGTMTSAAEQCGLEPREVALTIVSALTAGKRSPLVWVQADPFTGETSPVDMTSEQPGLALEIARQRNARAARRLLDVEEASATYSPVRLKPVASFLSEPAHETTWVVNKLLRRGYNATLTAPNKTGKTHTLADLLRALADGVPFMNRWEITDDDIGRVALFDYEMWPDDHRDKLAAFGIVNLDRVDIVHMRGLRAPLMNDNVTADIIAELRRREIGVWLVDPFARAYLGDESDNGEVGAWLDRIDIIKREAGVHSFVMPAHTGRREADVGDERSRGAMRLDDWPDMLWKLSKDKEGNRYFQATGRAGEVGIELVTMEPLSLRLTMGGGSPSMVARRRLEADVLDFVRDNIGCTQTDVIAAVRGGNERIKAVLAELQRTFAIRVEGGGKPGVAIHYFANTTSTNLA